MGNGSGFAPPQHPATDADIFQSRTWEDYENVGIAVARGQVTAGTPVAYWTAKHATQAQGWSLLWTIIQGVVDSILDAGVTLITKLQAQDNPVFYTLMQDLISDLLGVDFAPNALQQAWQKGGDIAAVKAGGALFLNRLAEETRAPLPPTPGPGLAAAEGLLGYIMAFSVREANVSTFLSLIPEEYRFLDGIRDYAVDLARNLGLGRISRQVLMPWLKTAIQDPLTRELNAQYRPTKLGAAAAIKAHNRGALSDAELSNELAWEGYTDRYAAALSKDQLTQLSDSDAWTLYRSGVYDGNQLAAALSNAGFDPGASGDYVNARIEADKQTWINALVTDWKTQLASGAITSKDFADLVQELKWPQPIKDAIKDAVLQLYELPRKTLTLAEVQSAFVEGLIDLDGLQAFLKQQGYSSDDADTLTQLTFLKLGTQAAKVKVAQYAYDKARAKAAAKGEPEPPPPAILAVG